MSAADLAPQTNQGAKQASVRASTGTALTYEGDWHALFDAASVAAGPFDGRMLAWINSQLSASYTNLPEAQQAYAVSKGAVNWSSLGAFTISSGLASATLDHSSILDKSATLTKVGQLSGNGGTWALLDDGLGNTSFAGRVSVSANGEMLVGLITPDRGVATSWSVTVRETVGAQTKDTVLTVNITAITAATLAAGGSVTFPRRNGETAQNAIATSVGLYGIMGANVTGGADGAIAFFVDFRRGSCVTTTDSQDMGGAWYLGGTGSSTVGRGFSIRYFGEDSTAATGTALKGRIGISGKDHASANHIGNYATSDADGSPSGFASGNFIRSAVITDDVPRLVVLRYTKNGATWNGVSVAALSMQVITIRLDTMAIEFGDTVTHTTWVGIGTSASKTQVMAFGSFNAGAAGSYVAATQSIANYFPGKISDFMVIAASGSDADWQAIASGVLPTTQFSGNVQYYWSLQGTGDLSQTAGTQTASAFTVASGSATTGQPMRPAYNAGNGLLCLSKGDGYVFGLRLGGATSRTITQQAYVIGAATHVQARVTRQSDNAIVSDWARVSTGTATGLQTFSIPNIPIGWDYYVELRREDDNTVVAIQRGRVRVGYKGAVVGQSQDDISVLGSGGPGSGIAIPSTKNLSFGLHRARNKQWRKVDIAVLEAGGDASNGMMAMMERLGTLAPTVPWMIVNHSQSGESLGSFYADQVTYSSSTYKMFGDYVTPGSGTITDLLLTAGKDISFFIHMHGTADQGRHATYQSLLNALYAGVSDGNEVFSNQPANGGPTVTTSIVRNYAAAGLDYPIVVGMVGIQRHAFVSTGAGATSALIKTFADTFADLRTKQVTWVPPGGSGITNVVLGYTHDVRLDTSIDTAHQGVNEVRGNARINYRYALGMLAMAGLSTYDPTPAPASASRSGAVITVTFNLKNGGSLVAPNAGAPVGFEVSEDGGTTWHSYNEGGDALGSNPGTTTGAIFTAAISGNTVTLTRKTSTWAANTQVRFDYGGPISYASVSQSSGNRTTNFGYENTDIDNMLYESRTDCAPTNGAGIVQGVPIAPTQTALVAA